MDSTDAEPATLLQWLFDAFNTQDWDRYRDLLADEFVLYESGQAHRGVDAAIEHDISFYETYPDGDITVEDLFASDDRVAARTSITGTPADGETAGVSGEDELDAIGLVIGHVEDGELTELWVLTE
jgi:predicted ester cyclase